MSGVWLRGVWVTADEIDAAIIATCLRPENTTEGRMYLRIVYGDSGAIVTTPEDEGALWELLHSMAVGPGKGVVIRKWSHPRYERWLKHNEWFNNVVVV